MKRFLALMLGAACLIGAPNADARLVSKIVPFQINRNGAEADSGSIGAIQNTSVAIIDTSASVVLKQALFNSPDYTQVVASAPDTLEFGVRFFFTCIADPNTNLTNADSVTFNVQGTYDGYVWFSIYNPGKQSFSGLTFPANVMANIVTQRPGIVGLGLAISSLTNKGYTINTSLVGVIAMRFIRLLTGVNDMQQRWVLTAQYIVPDNTPTDPTDF